MKIDENIIGKTFDFLANNGMDIGTSRIFDEANDKLRALGLEPAQIESFMDVFVTLDYEAFARGFKAACAISFMSGGAAL